MRTSKIQSKITTKITARFDSVDSAERAARVILRQVEDVDEIRLTECRRTRRERGPVPFPLLPQTGWNAASGRATSQGEPGVVPAVPPIFLSNGSGPDDSGPDGSEPERRCEAYLSVLTQTHAHEVERRLVNLGGSGLRTERG